MNRDSLYERSVADFVLFGLMFFAFVLGAGGVVTTSVPAAVTGAILFALGAVAFIVKAALEPS